MRLNVTAVLLVSVGGSTCLMLLLWHCRRAGAEMAGHAPNRDSASGHPNSRDLKVRLEVLGQHELMNSHVEIPCQG